MQLRITCWLAIASVLGFPPTRATSAAETENATIDPKEAVVTTLAKGKFDIELAPEKQEGAIGETGIGKMSIDKRFHGDLKATSIGMMLSIRTETPGSAGYVAIEKVSGTLGGRTGSFVLQHSATMRRGEPSLSVTVVPDSATGELEGLEGEMKIIITEGEHFYELEYSLPAELQPDTN